MDNKLRELLEYCEKASEEARQQQEYYTDESLHIHASLYEGKKDAYDVLAEKINELLDQ